MTEFTKEELIAEAHYNLEHCFCSDKTKRLMEIALAALTAGMEQEPVAWVMKDDLADIDIISTPAYPTFSDATSKTIGDLIPLYAAPQLPQPAVPFGFTDGDAHGMVYETRHADRLANPMPVYRLPPQPAVVPHPVSAVKGELAFIDHFERIIGERGGDIDIGQLGRGNYDALMLAALDAFRAAVLQGAEPVSDNTNQQFESLGRN